MAITAQRPVVAVVAPPQATYFDPKHGIIRRGRVKIRVLPPFSTKGLTSDDVGPLLEKVRGAMLAALQESNQH